MTFGYPPRKKQTRTPLSEYLPDWLEKSALDAKYSGGGIDTSALLQKSLAVYDARDNQFANIKADGTTDDSNAWAAIINGVKNAGGGTITWEGRSRILQPIPFASNIALIGRGWGRSVLAPEGNGISAIQMGGTLANPITNAVFDNFEIDGSAQISYAKGIFITFMKRAMFHHIWCHDTGASGLGCDFLVDTAFVDSIVENAGRNGTTSSPGCSGFGIGTGNYDVENVSLINCVGRGNKRYGAFFEKQATPTYNSKGVTVIGGRYEGNNRGIGDNGVKRIIVDGAHISGNTDAGYYLGMDASNGIGSDGLVTNCVITDNGTRGVHLDYTGSLSPGRYTIKGNQVQGNTSTGIKVETVTSAPNVVVSDNDVYLNKGPGVQLAGGGTFTDVEVSNNRIWSNGLVGGGSGILVGASLTRPRIVGNKISDPATTKTQGFGITINAGQTISGGIISRNDLSGNLTGAISNSGTISPGANGTVMRDNVGYNPIGWDSLSPAASPWTYTAGPTDEVINLLNGTVSNVAVTDRTGTTTNVALSAPASITLSPYDTMVVTYSAAPAVKRLRK